ncbi:MAG TPA: alpha/beta hydrolase [Bryobacteraceae bacterium]|nr:alpha/beta hydrolase [Bryobacteraceae bacterium]
MSAVLSAAPADHWTTLDRNRIHYQTSGGGSKAIVFVHGWGCDSTFWSQQVPAFEKRYRVVTLDLPGHGGSDQARLPYTIELFADAVDAVLKDAQVNSAVLAGHSMGAAVIRQYLANHPAPVAGLVIADGTVYPNEGEAGVERRKQRSAGFLVSLRAPDYKEHASKMIGSMFVEATQPQLREQILAKMLATPQHVLFSAMQNLIGTRVWLEKQTTVPVLAIAPANAKLPLGEKERIYLTHFRNLEFRTWEGAGHFLMMEQPKRFNEAVSRFLEKIGF